MQNSLEIANKLTLSVIALLMAGTMYGSDAAAQGVKDYRRASPIDLMSEKDRAEREKELVEPPMMEAEEVAVEAEEPITEVVVKKKWPEIDEDLEAAEPSVEDRPRAEPVPEAPKPIVVPKDPGISVMPVKHISLDTLGIYDASRGGVALDIWQGSDHKQIKEMMDALPDAIHSVAIRGLLTRLLLSITTPPESENIQQNVFHERIGSLIRMGEANQAARLLDMVPKDLQSERVMADRFRAHFMQGDDAWVCNNIADALTKFDTESTLSGKAHWQAYSIYCMTKEEKAAEVMLAIDLLHEQKRDLGIALEEIFLVKSGNLSKREEKLPFNLSPLHAAMIAQLGVSAFEAPHVSEAPLPVALLMAQNEALSDEIREWAAMRVDALSGDEKALSALKSNSEWLKKTWTPKPGKTIDVEDLAKEVERKLGAHEDDEATRILRRYRLYEVIGALEYRPRQDTRPWKQSSVELKQRVAPPALKEALEVAIATGRKGEAILLVAMIVGKVGDLAEMHDATLALLIRSLRRLGYEDEAEALAAEAVLALF